MNALLNTHHRSVGWLQAFLQEVSQVLLAVYWVSAEMFSLLPC